MELKNQNKLFNHFFTVMSRRNNAKNKIEKLDLIYRNRLVNMLVNRILRHGKKSLAYQILYKSMKSIKQRTKKNSLSVLRQAIHRVTPNVTVKARRVYHVMYGTTPSTTYLH